MTVQTQNSSVTHVALSTQTSYSFNFLTLSEDHMFISIGGVDYEGGFSVLGVGNPSGGTIVLDNSLPESEDGKKLVIRRIVPVTQETDYISYDGFSAESHEAALDKLTLIAQQLIFDNSKAIRVPVSDVLPIEDLTVGDAVSRANTIIGFDTSGKVVTLTVDTGVGVAQLQEQKLTVVPGQTEFTLVNEPKVVILDGKTLSKSASEWLYNPTTKVLTLSEAIVDADQVLITWNALTNLVDNDGSSNYIDIRDYGAVALDPSFDNSVAITAAVEAAELTNSKVVIYGGPYYMNTMQMDTKCSIIGGILAPGDTASETAPLIRVRVDGCRFEGITFDSNGTTTHGIQVNSNNNILTNIKARNIVGNTNTPGAASAIHLIGNNNIVDGLYVQDYLNGTAPNASLPRCLSISSGASHNSITNVEGFNIAAGLVHSDGTYNTLRNFKFDNSNPNDAEMRNGIYCIEGTIGFTASQGIIVASSQPIVDVGIDDVYKDIVEIDSFSDGIQFPCKNVTFDGIIKFWNDKTQDNGGFLRTRSSNSGQRIDGVTIQNCDIDLPTFYASFLVFDTGAVDNLIVKNNNVKTRHSVQGEPARDIVIHLEGSNVRYSGNTFTVVNDVAPFTSTEFFIISLPRHTTEGYWKNNEMYSADDNVVVRVIGVLDQESFRVEDTNQVRADIGKSWIQSGPGARALTGIAPPNSGAWRAGDSIQNTLVDLNPPAGQEYRRFLFFVCIKSGNFADANVANHPEFKPYVDLNSGSVIGQISQPTITSPTAAQEFNSTNVPIVSDAFVATGGITHASTNWQVATDASFTNIVFQSLADAVNLTSITATGLPNPSQLYVRVQYVGNGGELSPYSNTINFATSTNPSVDDSVGEASTFSLVTTSRTTNTQTLWVSTDKLLAFAGFEAGQLSRTTNNTSFTAVTNPTNPLYSIRDIDGADNKSRVFISGSTVSDTDIGVYFSTNPTAGTPTWTEWGGIASVGTAAIDVFVACDSTGLNAFICFGADTLDPSDVANSTWKSTNGGVTSSVVSSIDSQHGGAEAIHMAKNDPDKLFIVTAGSATNPGRISSSSNGGSSWTHVIPPGLSVGQKIFDIKSTPDGLTAYCCCQGGKMYKTTDGGTTWVQILAGVTTESVRSCVVSNDGEMVAFGLQNGDYLRSYDSGNNFNLTVAQESDKILAMEINSADNIMYYGGVSGLLKKSEL